jgi:hypothetical protein
MNITTGNDNSAKGGFFFTYEKTNQGGFTCPGGADQTNKFSLFDLKRHSVKRLFFIVNFRNFLDVNQNPSTYYSNPCRKEKQGFP